MTTGLPSSVAVVFLLVAVPARIRPDAVPA